jgi:Pyruvate/2-oxoacid:ferredoxin oxidoreductase delta subunit/nitroreductase
MPVITSRTKENAQIIIENDKCNLCELCIKVCKDLSLVIDENGKLGVSDTPLLGCFGCGQCAAICPNDAIKIAGREFSEDDLLELPKKDEKAGFDRLYSLMLSRRSVRDYKDKTVEQEIVEKIITASSTAPMGIPPSDVGLVVLNGREKVKEFTNDFLEFVKKSQTFFNSVIMALFRPFMSKESYELIKSFIIPLYKFLVTGWEKGENWLLYDAPLAIYFYGTSYADPADPIIPATYSMLAAESLGLGSCMIGTIGPMLKNGGKILKKKYGIYPKSPQGIMVIYGYPKYNYHKAIRRTFAKVNRI